MRGEHTVLKEISSTRTDESEPTRRWFSDKIVDLYVWYDDNGAVIQFQMCYDKGPGEKALTWTRGGGFVQHAVDDGEAGLFRMKSSPILTERGCTDTVGALKLLESRGAKLEHDLYRFISDTLRGAD
jgi:hypothetical protein